MCMWNVEGGAVWELAGWAMGSECGQAVGRPRRLGSTSPSSSDLLALKPLGGELKMFPDSKQRREKKKI